MSFKSPAHDLCMSLTDLSISRRTPSSAPRGNRSLSLANRKTPNLFLGKPSGKNGYCNLTPSRNPNFRGVSEGDRYIPIRDATQFEYANHCLVHHNSQNESSLLNRSTSEPSSPSTTAEREYKMKLMRAKSLSDVDMSNEERIFVYRKGEAPRAPGGALNHPKVIYTSVLANPSTSVRKCYRHIPTMPERILDAPCYSDDYYLNLLDWGFDDVVAVGLDYSVYLWNAQTGEIDALVDFPSNRGVKVTSVRWSTGGGAYLSVGLSDGQIKLFEPWGSHRVLRSIQSQVTRVGCMAWRTHVLSAGCQSGRILHHDVRVANHHIGTFDKHTQEVCGLQWSDDGRYMASGAGDSLVKVWDPSMLTSTDPAQDSVYTFSDHLATVKAVAFHPRHSHTLGTGGGSTDRCIKTWNLTTGTLCHSTETDSQVNAIAFSKHYDELITAHGFPHHSLKIWKYPSMNCLQELSGHTGRVLSLAVSPCGQYVMSGSGDESLRLWWCFKEDKNVPKRGPRKARTLLQNTVR